MRRKCLESLEARGNLEYVRERGVQYVVGSDFDPNIRPLAEHSTGLREGDLEFLGKIEECKSRPSDGYPYRVRP